MDTNEWEEHGFSTYAAQNHLLRNVSLKAAIAGQALGLKLSELVALREAGVDIEKLDLQTFPGPPSWPVKERALIAARGATDEEQQRWLAAGLSVDDCLRALDAGVVPSSVESHLLARRRLAAVKQEWGSAFRGTSAATRDAWRQTGLNIEEARAWHSKGFAPAHALGRSSDAAPTTAPPPLPRLVIDDRPPFIYKDGGDAVPAEVERIGTQAKTPDKRARRLRAFGFEVTITDEAIRRSEREQSFLEQPAMLSLRGRLPIRVITTGAGVSAEGLADDGSTVVVASASNLRSLITDERFVEAATGWSSLNLNTDDATALELLSACTRGPMLVNGIAVSLRRSLTGPMYATPYRSRDLGPLALTVIGNRTLRTATFCGVLIDASGVPIGASDADLDALEIPVALASISRPSEDELLTPVADVALGCVASTPPRDDLELTCHTLGGNLDLREALAGEVLIELVPLSDTTTAAAELVRALGPPGSPADDYEMLASHLGVIEVPVRSPVVVIGGELYLWVTDEPTGGRWLRHIREDESIELAVDDLAWVSMFESGSMVSGTSLVSVGRLSDGSPVVRYDFDEDEVSYCNLPRQMDDHDVLLAFANDAELGWNGASEAFCDAVRRRLPVLDAVASDYGEFSDSMELRVVLSERALAATEGREHQF